MKKDTEKLQHFSIRKLSIGAASVLIGIAFLGSANISEVHADSVSENATPVVNHEIKQTKNDNPASSIKSSLNKSVDNSATASQINENEATKEEIQKDKKQVTAPTESKKISNQSTQLSVAKDQNSEANKNISLVNKKQTTPTDGKSIETINSKHVRANDQNTLNTNKANQPIKGNAAVLDQKAPSSNVKPLNKNDKDVSNKEKEVLVRIHIYSGTDALKVVIDDDNENSVGSTTATIPLSKDFHGNPQTLDFSSFGSLNYIDKNGQKHELHFNDISGSTDSNVIFKDQYGNANTDPAKLITGNKKDIYLWAVDNEPISEEYLKVQQSLNKQPLKVNNKTNVDQVFVLPDKFKDGTYGVASIQTWTYESPQQLENRNAYGLPENSNNHLNFYKYVKLSPEYINQAYNFGKVTYVDPDNLAYDQLEQNQKKITKYLTLGEIDENGKWQYPSLSFDLIDSKSCKDLGIDKDFPDGITILDLPQVVQKLEAEKGNTDASINKINTYKEVLNRLHLNVADNPLKATKTTVPSTEVINAEAGFVTLIPEYDKNGKIIPDKFAGKLLYSATSKNEDNLNTGLKIKYIPLDPTYTGDLGRIYGYANVGDGGIHGFLTIKLENQSAAKTVHETIHYVDESNKTLAPDFTDRVDLTSKDGGKTWTGNKDGFKDVTSPTIKGYTPDKDVVKGEKVDGNSGDLIVTVVYHKLKKDSETIPPTPNKPNRSTTSTKLTSKKKNEVEKKSTPTLKIKQSKSKQPNEVKHHTSTSSSQSNNKDMQVASTKKSATPNAGNSAETNSHSEDKQLPKTGNDDGNKVLSLLGLLLSSLGLISIRKRRN